MQTLDKDLPIPLYHQLKTILQTGIESGEWESGQRLPAEGDLAQQFGVSKITVRQALKELEQIGYVRREQGKGTFVSSPTLAQGPRELTSFTEEMRRHGFLPASRVLESRVTAADAPVAEALERAPGDPVFMLRRLRLADGEPMGVQTAFIPLDLAPGLASESFENSSLYDVLQTKYGRSPATARETHSAIPVGKVEAALLGVDPGSPAMAAERIAYLPGGQPLEYVTSIMRGDRYRIVLDLVKEAARSQRR